MMTLGVTSTIALKGSRQQMNNNIGQLELSQGDVIRATVVDLRGTSISIAVDEGADQKILNLQLNKELNLTIQDQIEIEVLKANKDTLQLSIRQVDEDRIEMAKSHNPVSDSVNLDEVKKSIVTSNNPLQFSKQLDHHIEHAIAQVETMLESFNDEELVTILRENFDVTKMTIDLLYQVGHSNRVDKKVALVDDGNRSVDISVNEDKINMLIQELSQKSTLANVNSKELEIIVKELINNDISPKPNHVEKILHFIDKVDQVKQMSSDEIVRFLSSNKDSSVAELHKSLYISQKNVKKDVISEKDYNAIESEVKKIVDSNFDFTDQAMMKEVSDIAKALVKKGIPIDERAIETLKYIKAPVKLEETIKLAAIQIKRQEKLDEIIVTDKTNTVEILKKEEVEALTTLVRRFTNDHVQSVVLKNRSVSFHELEIQSEELELLSTKDKTLGDEIQSQSRANSQEEIPTAVQVVIDKNVENLQIIRYQMTYKAAMSLSIQGVDLKHTSLDIIRERIESFDVMHIETSKELPKKVDVDASKSSDIQLGLDETRVLSQKELAVLEVKKHMAIISSSSTRSIASLALNATDPKDITLSNIVKSASSGADRYDELRTMPRKDLGDRIEKAFANVKDILADLNLEDTRFNQRAVEILGRNEMAITIEHIEAVKEMDIQLQELFTKLMPEHVKTLVDQQVNVMQEPIDKLLDFVNLQDSSVLKDMDDQVAKHIMMMLKNNGITTEQKDALVGVYRMIHSIENSKGAAVGFLLNNHLDVTLENLFDAAKVIRQSSNGQSVIDAEINDSFGKLETISRDAMTIKQQIQSGYLEKEMDLNAFVSKVMSGDYSKTMANTDGLNRFIDDPNVSGNPENVGLQQNISQVTSDVEKDLKMINALVEKEDVLELKDILTVVQKMQKGQLREQLKQNSHSSLNDIKALDNLSKNPAIVKDLLKQFVELNTANEPLREKLVTKISEFMDHLTPKGQEDFQKGMKEVISEAKDLALKDFFNKQSQLNSDMSMKESSSFTGDKSLQQVSKDVESQLGLQKQLIDHEDYYSVPVMINGELQHMSMHYFKQDHEDLSRNDDMSVYFSFTTEHLGTANIRVQLKGDDSTITMYATKDVGNRQLKHYENEMKEMFNDVGFSVNKLKYDTFLLPTPVKQDQKIATANKVSKYSNNLFEKSI